MPQDLIRYDLLVQDALKGVVRKVLADAAAHGLPGEHHFYISFRTGDPGVRISNRLYSTTTPLDTLPSSMIERIEVLKGGQGLYYGTQAVSGIVNVITRGFSREFDGAIEASVDTNEGYHLNGYARGSAGDHYFVGFASHDETDGFQAFRDRDLQPSALDRNRGYNDFRPEGPHGLEHLDRPD